MFNFKQYNFKKLNFSLIFLVLLVAGIGTYMISIADTTEGVNLFQKQIFGIIAGSVIAAVVVMIDYHFICTFAILFYLFGLILLFLVRVPGIGVSLYDAQRWLQIGPVQIQPSEFVKVIMIIVLATFFSKFINKINKFTTILFSLLLIAIPLFFILMQPDLSSSLVLMFVYVIMIYTAGISYKIILPVVIVGVPSLVGLVWYILQTGSSLGGLINKYQLERILGLLHPEEYEDIMHQQNTSVKYITSGKLYGILTGSVKVEDLSSPRLAISESDFIFTVIAETLGFIGTCVIMLLLAIIIFKCLAVARRAKDVLGKLICAGVASMLMFQIFVNIGVATRIIPNTGLPLPFLSYGLSALVSYMVSIGLVLNVDLQGKSANTLKTSDYIDF